MKDQIVPAGKIRKLSARMIIVFLGYIAWNIGSPSYALAQESATPEAPSSIPDITVTAQRSASVLRETPISAGVIDSSEISDKDIVSLSDIEGVIAGVTVPNGYSNMPQAVAIRGVGASLPAMSQAVGIYLDDVPLIRGYATALWDLPDIQRIEVLRGPQGTLYGQNTTAGAVKFVTRDPGPDTSGWISGSIGNYGAQEIHGYYNGANTDGTVADSFAFSRRTNDGFGHNATLNQDINKLDVTQFDEKLRISPNHDLDAVISLDGLQDRSDANTLNYPLNHANSAPRISYTSVDTGEFKRDAGGVSLKLSDQLNDNLLFRSITAIRAYKDDPTVADYGGLEVQRYGISQTVSQQAYSQEFQLQAKYDKLAWTAGTMFIHDRFEFDRYSVMFPLAASLPSYNEAQTALETNDLGLYGQGRYALSETTGITFGLRTYRTEQFGSNEFWLTDAEQQRTAVIYDAPNLSMTKTGWLPRLSVDHQMSQDVFTYTSISEGEKFGGFNRAAESLIAAEVATQPEKVIAYEVGSKARLADGHATLNVAVFYNDYRNYLASLTNTYIDGVLVTDSVLLNAGKVKSYGLDAELSTKLEKHTTWTLSTELLRSRFDAFLDPTGTANANYVGNQLPNAPALSLGSSLLYLQPLADGGQIKIEPSVQYIRQQFSDVANTPGLEIPSQTYINVQSEYITPQKQWTFTLRVKNLMNKSYPLIIDQIPPLGVDAAYYNPPRTVMFTAKYRF